MYDDDDHWSYTSTRAMANLLQGTEFLNELVMDLFILDEIEKKERESDHSNSTMLLSRFDVVYDKK